MSNPDGFRRNILNYSIYSLLPSPSTSGGQGIRAVVSSSHVVSVTPYSPGGGLLTLIPCSKGLSRVVQSFRNRVIQGGSSVGPQVLPGASSSVGFPGDGSFLQTSTCSGTESFPGCGWISAPPWNSMGCRGTPFLSRVCIRG